MDKVIILIAFAVYMVVMIVIGAVYVKNTKTNEDYFLGGRNLGSWTAALSAQASDMSGWLLMGLPGAVYIAGTGEIWIAIGLLIGTVLNWYLVSGRLRRYTIKANNSLTIPGYFENRFHDKTGILQVVSSIIITVFFTVYTASAFSSGAKLFATVFSDGTTEGFNSTYVYGLVIAAVVILVYTFMGGFKAVCATDLVQGFMMLIAILAVPILAYGLLTYNTGFRDALIANGVENPGDYLNFMKNADGSPVSAVTIISNLGWALGYFGMPHILVRFMAIRSEAEVKKSRTIAIVWIVLSLGAACMIGLVARGFLTSQLDASTQETVFIKLIQQLFSSNYLLLFIGGVFLCGILAAVMSTADSQLLVTASAVSEDLYRGTINKNASDKKSLAVGRAAVVVVAVVAAFIALDPNSSIMGLVSNAWAGFGAAFGPVIIFSLFWRRSNLQGAVSAMAIGALTIIVWDYIPLIEGQTLGNATGLYSLVVGFILASAAMIIVSLATKAPGKEITDEFDAVKSGKVENC